MAVAVQLTDPTRVEESGGSDSIAHDEEMADPCPRFEERCRLPQSADAAEGVDAALSDRLGWL